MITGSHTHARASAHEEHLAALRRTLGLDGLEPAEFEALRRSAAGRPVRSRLANQARAKLAAPSRAAAVYNALAVGLLEEAQITDEELEALRMLASGASTEEIGALTDRTTRRSRSNYGAALLRSLRAKLGAASNENLILLAYRLRLIDPEAGSPPLPPWSA